MLRQGVGCPLPPLGGALARLGLGTVSGSGGDAGGLGGVARRGCPPWLHLRRAEWVFLEQAESLLDPLEQQLLLLASLCRGGGLA